VNGAASAEQARPISSARSQAEQDLLARFGEAFESGTRQAQAIADPATRAMGAARIALEHAILQTAQEKETPAPVVASMLERASPQQVAHFIREGKRSIQRNYGVEPEAMVAALSAGVVKVDLPRGFAQTEALRQLVEQGRSLVDQSIVGTYQMRGQFTDTGNSDYLSSSASPAVTAAQTKLRNHMIFVESAIDHAVRGGRLDATQGQMLKERVEHQVFTPPQDTKFSPGFRQFYDSAGRTLRSDVMREARSVVNNTTVAQIAERLQEARQRGHHGLER
jgi:hypothetical protein